MATESPFALTVYDKRLRPVGAIGSPVAVNGSVLLHKPGSFQLVLDPADPMVEDVLAKGSRLGVEYRGQPLFSGKRRALSGGITAAGNVQCTFQGDRRELDNVLALIAPGNPITPTSLDASTAAGQAQAPLPPGTLAPAPGTTGVQAAYTIWPDDLDSAESAIKWLLTTNLVDRVRRPVYIPPSQGRGGQVPLPNLRNPPLSEAIQSILDASGLQVTAIQKRGDEFVTIDVRQSGVWAAPLTKESGILDDGVWSLTPPTATRMLIGGPGEGAARAFFELRDSTGLEDEYGDVIEVFRDATGANLKWPDSLSAQYKVPAYFLLRNEVPDADKALFRSYINTAGQSGLVEGQPTTSVSATLSETEQFYFGGSDGIQLGDRVTIKTEGGVTLEDVVTEGKFSYTASGGLDVSPILGARKDDPNRRIADAIVRLATGQRTIQRDR